MTFCQNEACKWSEGVCVQPCIFFMLFSFVKYTLFVWPKRVIIYKRKYVIFKEENHLHQLNGKLHGWHTHPSLTTTKIAVQPEVRPGVGRQTSHFFNLEYDVRLLSDQGRTKTYGPTVKVRCYKDCQRGVCLCLFMDFLTWKNDILQIVYAPCAKVGFQSVEQGV